VPIGYAVNPNVAMVTGFRCIRRGESRRRGEDGLRFFRYGLAHHYIFVSTSGRTDIWPISRRRATLAAPARHGIGTPDQLRTHLRHFENPGVDQTVFISAGAATSTSISATRCNCSHMSDAGIQGARDRA